MLKTVAVVRLLFQLVARKLMDMETRNPTKPHASGMKTQHTGLPLMNRGTTQDLCISSSCKQTDNESNAEARNADIMFAVKPFEKC